MSKPIDQEREAFALIPVERSYDMRAAAILHYNTARKAGADLDDALDSAWRATLAKAHRPDDEHNQQTAGVAVPDATGRTPQDYAIEHAEYMAVASESVLADYQAYSLARMAVDEGGDDGEGEKAEAIHNAEQDLVEALVKMRGMIYEFRKRRDRAAGTRPVSGEHKWSSFEEWVAWEIDQGDGTSAPVSDQQLALAKRLWSCLAGHRAQQGERKPSPSFVVSLPVPVKPEEPDEGIDDSWMDAYNSAMRMRADCVAAIEQAGGQVVQGEQP